MTRYSLSHVIDWFFKKLENPDGSIIISDMDGTFNLGFTVLNGDGTPDKEAKIPSDITYTQLFGDEGRDAQGYLTSADGKHKVTRMGTYAVGNSMNGASFLKWLKH